MSRAITLNGQHVAEKMSVVRTRSYANTDPERIVAALRAERFTGRVTIDMSQGGVCVVQAEDRSSLSRLTEESDCA